MEKTTDKSEFVPQTFNQKVAYLLKATGGVSTQLLFAELAERIGPKHPDIATEIVAILTDVNLVVATLKEEILEEPRIQTLNPTPNGPGMTHSRQDKRKR